MRKRWNPKSRRRFLLAAATAAVSALIVFHGSVILGAGLLLRPFTIAGAWEGEQFGSASARTGISKEEALGLAVDKAEFERLKAENDSLREQIGFVERQGFRAQAARILLRTATKQSSAFVIDKGSADGVAVGMPAVAGSGVMVGKVTSVRASTATVTGVSDRQSAVAVALLNQGRTVGIAEGTTGNLLSLRFVPHDQPMAVSDLVVTSGLEERVPANLLIGIITAVQADANAPFQEAVVEPLLDMRKEHLVSILIAENPL